MSFDIYGNPLRPGYCEAHPDIAEPFPCSICRHRQQLEQVRIEHEARIANEQREFRDKAAIAAMKAILSNESYSHLTLKETAGLSFEMAGQMLEEREK